MASYRCERCGLELKEVWDRKGDAVGLAASVLTVGIALPLWAKLRAPAYWWCGLCKRKYPRKEDAQRSELRRKLNEEKAARRKQLLEKPIEGEMSSKERREVELAETAQVRQAEQRLAQRPYDKDALEGLRLANRKRDEFISRFGIHGFSPDAFEFFVANMFSTLGYSSERVGRVNDHGIDIRLMKDAQLEVVQCKRYLGSIGPSVVRDLFGTMHHEGAVRAHLVTTGVFTKAARKWAEGKPINLVDGVELNSLWNKAGSAYRERRDGNKAARATASR